MIHLKVLIRNLHLIFIIITRHLQKKNFFKKEKQHKRTIYLFCEIQIF